MGYTLPKTLTERGTLLFVDREVFDVHVVVGINPTAQLDVCASTVHFFFFLNLNFTFQLLDKLWSQVSAFSPPVRAFTFYRA